MAAGGSALTVLLDEKRINDLLEQRSGLKAIIRSACNVVLFMCFLALYTVLAIGEPFGDMRTFEGYVRRRFDEDAPMPLHEVDSASTFWQYTQNSFLPALYGANTEKYFYPGAVPATLLPIEDSNRLFGVVRLRMLKIKPGMDCDVPDVFRSSFPPGRCYGPFSQEAEDREDYGPIRDDGEKSFRYMRMSTGQSFSGDMGVYPQGGFMEALTSNYGSTKSRVDFLQQHDWLSEATRALFYEFTVYNFNLGLYAVCRIAFEVAPSGRWSKTFDIEVLTQRHLSALGFASTAEWMLLVGEVVLVLFVLRYLMEEASELYGSARKLDYFLDLWNILDLLNLILIITALGLRISAWAEGGLEVFTGPPQDQGVATFTDYSTVAQNVRNLRGLVAFNTVLTWFKTVKYYSVVPYIRVFMVTVMMSQRSLFCFVVIFAAVHFGFVVSYSVAFGESLFQLRTTWKANLFLFRVFLGDGSFEEVVERAPTVGPFLLVLTVLGMIFILMNLFSAIMIRALADARHSQDAKIQQNWEQVVERMNQAWNHTKHVLQLDQSLRQAFPGLHSRYGRRKKKIEELEAKRDMSYILKQLANMPDDLAALGAGSPTCGRRRRKALAAVAIKDGDSDDGSEADLGPLVSKDQLQFNVPQPGASPGGAAVGGNGMPMDRPPRSGDEESSETPSSDPDSQAVELLLDATRYVAAGIVERTRGARGALFSEMADSKEVLLGLGTVLQVLSQRARDLEAQQTDALQHS